ncbi:MAG: hypothetical protein ACI9LM_004397 [Alteromonadaceae bacterium]|jgi:hypothetical protein
MIKLKFMLLACIAITALMVLLILNNRRGVSTPDQLMVRPLDMVAVLPPPPPPKNISEPTPVQALKLDLRHQGHGPSLALSKVKLKIAKPTLIAPELNNLTPDFDINTTTFDLSGFSLDELDQQPRLMTPLHIAFTSKMQRAGVKKIKVKLHVVIDQNGKVHLKKIQENPYPELNHAIRKLTKKARFSAPSRQGKKVQAEFIWPLMLKES